jgi:hypothetical protein
VAAREGGVHDEGGGYVMGRGIISEVVGVVRRVRAGGG